MVSKVTAEKAAWDLVGKEKPGLTLTTINPPMVYGPAIQGVNPPSFVNTSNQLMADLTSGKFKEGMPATGLPLWVDVRDVALAHVRAMGLDNTANKCFFVTAGHYSNSDLLRIVRENFLEVHDKLPKDGAEPPKDLLPWGLCQF
jgi:nucleoside-diphosphate-sugar epimerase